MNRFPLKNNESPLESGPGGGPKIMTHSIPNPLSTRRFARKSMTKFQLKVADHISLVLEVTKNGAFNFECTDSLRISMTGAKHFTKPLVSGFGAGWTYGFNTERSVRATGNRKLDNKNFSKT